MKPRTQAETTLTEAAGVTLPAITEQASGRSLLSIDSPVFREVNVTLEANLGQTTLTIEDLLALKAGSIIKLNLKLNDLVELRLNQSLVARGEVVAVDDNFGVRIVEIATAS